MRFMVLRKADKNSEACVLPDEKLLAAFEKYKEEGVKSGLLLAGEGLLPSSEGVRVKFSAGKVTVIDGPFSEAKELVGGFGLIEVNSKEEAIEAVKGWPALDSEAELEIRELGCVSGLRGYSLADASARPTQTSPSGSATPMRFLILYKADENFEAGIGPSEQVLAAMAKRNEEGMKSGIMLAGEGLKPSSSGVRVKFSAGKPTVIDGPFTEVKELIAGFWLIRVFSKEEAIEWVKSYPYPISDEGEVEIRQVSDFEARIIPKLKEAEERMRSQVTQILYGTPL